MVREGTRWALQPVVAIAAVLAVIAGCATPVPPQTLPLRDAPPLSETSGLPRASSWWEDFEDPALAAFVEEALSSNFSLRVASERLREARALAGQALAAKSPALDIQADGAERDGSEIDREGEVGLSLLASYEVDLWGRIRAEVRAERLEAAASVEDYEAAAVTISAEVARAVYRLTEGSSQLALLERQLQTNRDVLEVIEGRFSIGQSGAADVLRQRQLVEATVEQQIVTRSSIELLEHQLSVLLGAPPQRELAIARPTSLPALAGLPEVGLPAELLQRRPDVRAAWLRLQSADASVAAAVKDQYPTLKLGAALQTSAESPSGLFDTWLGSLTAQILGPIVDGGRRRRAVERTVAVRRQRLAEYGEAVLASFLEVEDALALERRQTRRIESLEKQLALAKTTYVELRNQYLNGAADFIDVLAALREQQQLERSVLAARLLLTEHRIALHRALAGGFLGVSPGNSDDGVSRAARAKREGSL